jgi:hypothetical protein
MLNIDDKWRSLKAAAMVVVTKPNLISPRSFALQKLEKLNRWFMMLRFDPDFLLDNATPPVQRELFAFAIT